MNHSHRPRQPPDQLCPKSLVLQDFFPFSWPSLSSSIEILLLHKQALPPPLFPDTKFYENLEPDRVRSEEVFFFKYLPCVDDGNAFFSCFLSLA